MNSGMLDNARAHCICRNFHMSIGLKSGLITSLFNWNPSGKKRKNATKSRASPTHGFVALASVNQEYVEQNY